MPLLAQYLAPLLLVMGSFLCATGAVGIIRFPDFFTRVHASSVSDTLGAGLILVALILLSNSVIEVIKLGMILAFLLITGPTAIHALAKAAFAAGTVSEINSEEIDIRADEESSSRRS